MSSLHMVQIREADEDKEEYDAEDECGGGAEDVAGGDDAEGAEGDAECAGDQGFVFARRPPQPDEMYCSLRNSCTFTP